MLIFQLENGPVLATCAANGYCETPCLRIDGFGCCAPTVRIVSMAMYGTNARVSDIVCLCRRRVHYSPVKESVGVLASGIVHNDSAQTSC